MSELEIPFGGNLVICCSTGGGGDGKFSCLITDEIPDLNVVRSGQAFPMFIYEYQESAETDLTANISSRRRQKQPEKNTHEVE